MKIELLKDWHVTYTCGRCSKRAQWFIGDKTELQWSANNFACNKHKKLIEQGIIIEAL